MNRFPQPSSADPTTEAVPSVFDGGCPLLARLGAVFERNPQAVAIAGQDRLISYRELAGAIAECRDRFEALQLPAHTSVAVVSGGSIDLVSTFLGIRAAGLVPLMIDSLIPAGRRIEIIETARVAAVLDLNSGAEPVPGSAEARVLPGEAGYLTFSSGSQGTPKGIIGSASGLVSFLDWEQSLLRLEPASRVAMLSAPSFDVLLRDMFLPLISGGTLCVPGIAVRTDPSAVLPWLAENRVQVAHLVPSLSNRWVAASAGSVRLPELRWTLFAGEPLYARHVDRWTSLAPASQVVNLYGPSETTLAKFWHVVELPPPTGLQPVGRPLPGTRLVDAESGGSFRITIETPDGSLGYLDGASIQADQFRQLTRHDGVTRFATQDRGRLDAEGRLYVEGRLDSLVKRNGVLVDLVQVTTRALGDPQVGQAYCMQVEQDASGDVVLAVEAASGFSLRELSRDLRRALGPAMPNEILVFDAFPLLPNGKVDGKRLRSEVERRRALRRVEMPTPTARNSGPEQRGGRAKEGTW